MGHAKGRHSRDDCWEAGGGRIGDGKRWEVKGGRMGGRRMGNESETTTGGAWGDVRLGDVGEGLGEMRSCDSFGAISVTAPGKIEDFGRFWVELCHLSGKNCHSSASRTCKITEN